VDFSLVEIGNRLFGNNGSCPENTHSQVFKQSASGFAFLLHSTMERWDNFPWPNNNDPVMSRFHLALIAGTAACFALERGQRIMSLSTLLLPLPNSSKPLISYRHC
jgi:hypothetical protein